jgi:hypothetical protein
LGAGGKTQTSSTEENAEQAAISLVELAVTQQTEALPVSGAGQYKQSFIS